MAKQDFRTKWIHKRNVIKQNQVRRRISFFLERGFRYGQAEMLARGRK